MFVFLVYFEVESDKVIQVWFQVAVDEVLVSRAFLVCSQCLQIIVITHQRKVISLTHGEWVRNGRTANQQFVSHHAIQMLHLLRCGNHGGSCLLVDFCLKAKHDHMNQHVVGLVGQSYFGVDLHRILEKLKSTDEPYQINDASYSREVILQRSLVCKIITD